MSKKLLLNTKSDSSMPGDGLIQDNLIGWFDGREPGESVAKWTNKGSLGPGLDLNRNGPISSSTGFMNNGHKFVDNVYFESPLISINNLDFKNFTLFVAFEFTKGQKNTYEAVIGLTMSARHYVSINAKMGDVPSIVLPNTIGNESALNLNLPSWKTVVCYGADETQFYCYDENGIELHRSKIKSFTSPTELYLTLGQLRKDTASRKFNGYIYDVALYSKGLTEEEIKQNLNFLKNRLNA